MNSNLIRFNNLFLLRDLILITKLLLYVRISGRDPLGNTDENIPAIKCYQSNNFVYTDTDKGIIKTVNEENFTEMHLDLNLSIDPDTIPILRIFKMDELMPFQDTENVTKYKFYKSIKNKEIYVAEKNPTRYDNNIPIYIKRPVVP